VVWLEGIKRHRRRGRDGRAGHRGHEDGDFACPCAGACASSARRSRPAQGRNSGTTAPPRQHAAQPGERVRPPWRLVRRRRRFDAATRDQASPGFPLARIQPARAPPVEWVISCIPAVRVRGHGERLRSLALPLTAVQWRGAGVSLAARMVRSGGTDELQPGLALDRVEQRPESPRRRWWSALSSGTGNRITISRSRIGEAEMALGAQPAELDGEVLRQALVLRVDRIAVLLKTTSTELISLTPRAGSRCRPKASASPDAR